MLRVSLSELSRLPPEKLAKLLLEWASRDRTLLTRLQGTVEEDASADPASGAAHDASSHGPRGATPAAFVGDSTLMLHLSDMIERFARTGEPVLITGESGTGKELAARAIHRQSTRASGPFCAVNCAAIPPNLIASELFGHEKGAFTGAAARTRGQVEHANGGTLFLDEIGDMPMELQGYLLRFLQEGQIVRVGGRETIDVDVRVVAATNVRLRQAISDGRFREDLYYRLNVLALELPPLRERPRDIELLAHHFLREAATQYGREITGFDDDALAVLRQYHWPGNVRELMSTVRRAVVVGRNATIERSDLIGLETAAPERRAAPVDARPAEAPPAEAPPAEVSKIPAGQSASPIRPPPGSSEERAILLAAMTAAGENIAVTARELGVSRVTLYRMLRRHGIVPSRGFNPIPGAIAGTVPGTIPGAAAQASTIPATTVAGPDGLPPVSHQDDPSSVR